MTIALTTSGSTATVTWAAPLSDGGSPVSSYIVALSNGRTLEVPGLTASFAGLPAGTITANVSAKNSFGVGPPSVNSAPAVVTPPPFPAQVYARWRAALAAVLAGTGYAKAGVHGDSTSAGYGGTGVATPSRTNTPVVYLKARLNAIQSLPAIASNFIADQSLFKTNSISPFTFDSRLTQPDGTGYAAPGNIPTVAGSVLQNATNAFRLGFLPEVPADTHEIYYPINTTLDTTTVARAGATSGTINQVGTSSTGKFVFTTPLDGVNPLYFSRGTTSSYLIGVDSYNSTIKSIRLFGLGWAGGKAADWIGNTTGFDPLPSLLALGLDLVLFRPGINDYATGTTVAAFTTQISTLVDALIASGTNVVMATFYPSNVTYSAGTTQANQDLFAAAIRSVAAARNLRVRDTYADWGTWVNANALGYMYDGLHPNALGYQVEAAATASLLLSL